MDLLDASALCLLVGIAPHPSPPGATAPTLQESTSPANPSTAPATALEQAVARPDKDAHDRMVAVLRDIGEQTPRQSFYLGTALHQRLLGEFDELPPDAPAARQVEAHQSLALEELRLGNSERAVELLQTALERSLELPRQERRFRRAEISYNLGVAAMRWGETQNCVARHTAQSCLLPIEAGGVHSDPEGSKLAMRAFARVCRLAPPETAVAEASRWLYNVAAMTVGVWPDEVPEELLVPPATFTSEVPFPRFHDVAPELGVASFNLSGGAAAEDFDGDGDFDLVTSTWDTAGSMHYLENAGEGRFPERSTAAGISELTGGLNINHADYDGDGDADLLVLRGAWLGARGRHPNSLLANDGHAVFRDVTFDVGLGQVHYPTQTADWADYDLDGDLDLYIGNEAAPGAVHPSQLFQNTGEGTFRDVATEAGVTNLRFAKGVSFGDYDNDGDPDLYVSNLQSLNRLYRNGGDGTFEDVARELDVTAPSESFPTWFWDFDNDGWLDLFVASYPDGGIPERLAAFVRSQLGEPARAELAALYRNDGQGGFAEVAEERGLTRLNLAMGANYGDLDNDGWLDFYLGTGYPFFDGLMPNAMYLNRSGQRFADVTSAGGFGHLQKGHGVVFCDFDGDGDLDVFEQMGGAYPADAFGDALFENPGFGRHWLGVELVGVRSNRAGIGARLRVHSGEGEGRRTVHREIGTGGSFGANPRVEHVGLGAATQVDLEVYWPASGVTQSFEGVAADRHVRVTEGEERLEVLERPRSRLHPPASK